LRTPQVFEQFKADVADANIFIGSLIFVQELADKVVEVLTPNRDRLDAVLIFPSMPEVMRLNKVGQFTMANLGQSKSVIGEFMKKKKKENGSSFEEGMLKLLRTLPKVLKYLPSEKAKDARSFMMSFQYWLGGSPENLQSMLLMLAKEFVTGAQINDNAISEPVVIADKGIWHPMAPNVFETVAEYNEWYEKVHCPAAGIDAKKAVTVGLVLQKSHINTKDEPESLRMFRILSEGWLKLIKV
jgi:magnesium chelatase subunit H